MKVYVTKCMAEARADEVRVFVSYEDARKYIDETLHERGSLVVRTDDGNDDRWFHYAVEDTKKKGVWYEYWFDIYECELDVCEKCRFTFYEKEE